MLTYAFDNNGKLTTPNDQELRAADHNTTILTYTTGTLEDGRPYYAYIAVDPSRYREFHAMTSYNKPIILGDYGEIIAAGFKVEAPEDVKREMCDVYGYDEAFADKLKAEVERQRKEFSAKREEKNILDIVAMLKAQQKPA